MDRTDRISKEVQKELSDLIQYEIKDPRLPKFVSITSVRVTKDLRYATVYVSVLGTEDQKKDALEALKSASGFIRREIGQRINLRYTPEFRFKLDDSIEHGMYISRLIDETMGSGSSSGKSDDEKEDEK
ncbi:MAG: 30S ribosome-binding factor RbfA [Clostridiaceae bacterium]|nr:30S ribosome-binding factor RbfA [Clostridiaceae bacterium]